jgi:hypothetical protein
MIGSGIPISQSNAPFPNDMIVSILFILTRAATRWGSIGSVCRLLVPREIASRREPR